MHHLHTKSLISKHKTNKSEFHTHEHTHTHTLWIFTANQCDFCCCLSKMCSFTLASATHIIFAIKSVPCLHFYVYHPRKGLLAKICCNRWYKYLEGFLSNKRVRYDLMTPSRWENYCFEEFLLNLSLMQFNDFVQVFNDGQAERDVMNSTSGVNQTAEPLKLTHRTPGVRSNPV